MTKIMYKDIEYAGGTVDSTPIPTSYRVSEFDSDAHMNSTDMTTGSGGEVEEFIDELNITGGLLGDYVVEQGTDGIWTYRKWNSGIAECWGRTSVASTAYSANGGYKNVVSSLPSGLFNASPNVVEASGRIQGNIQTMIGFTAPNSATEVQTYLVNRSGSAVTNVGYIDWNIKGTWK